MKMVEKINRNFLDDSADSPFRSLIKSNLQQLKKRAKIFYQQEKYQKRLNTWWMLLMKSKFTAVISWDQEELTKMNQPFTKIFFRVIQEKGTHFANPFFANILFQYPPWNQ